jgi:hypothetical protein
MATATVCILSNPSQLCSWWIVHFVHGMEAAHMGWLKSIFI